MPNPSLKNPGLIPRPFTTSNLSYISSNKNAINSAAVVLSVDPVAAAVGLARELTRGLDFTGAAGVLLKNNIYIPMLLSATNNELEAAYGVNLALDAGNGKFATKNPLEATIDAVLRLNPLVAALKTDVGPGSIDAQNAICTACCGSREGEMNCAESAISVCGACNGFE